MACYRCSLKGPMTLLYGCNSALVQNYSDYEPVHHELSTPGGGWGRGPEQLVVTGPCAGVYSGTLNTPGAPAGVLEFYI